MVDPPWHYQDFVSYPGSRVVRNGQGLQGGQRRVAKPLPYDSMSCDELAALPVADLADRNCALWLWTTSAYLPDAFPILAAWGFKYRQLLVWHKHRAAPALGGSVAPNHAEFLLLGKRGAPKLGRLPSSVIQAPGNSGGSPKHSRKPEAFLDAIERVSPGPWAELFSRRARFGWEYPIGDEALGGVAVGASCS